jgi:hypothetical protein
MSSRAAGKLPPVTGSDLVYRGFGTGGIDFLEDWTPRATLVFNPPGAKVDGNGKILDKEYANKFVLHALQVAQQVAVIVPIPFLCGKWRGKHLYRPHPPAWILPLSARASRPWGHCRGCFDYLSAAVCSASRVSR